MKDAEARADLGSLGTALTAADERLKSIDAQLSSTSAVTDAEDLAKALAALLPHVHTDDCPVCGRNFGEVSDEPLVAHLAARISGLSERAERLSSLARARLEAVADNLARLEEERRN